MYVAAKGMRGSKLQALRPALRKWIHLNSTIGSQWAREYEDAPWWYNERASLSFFAGAVWMSGGWALEEFSSRKKGLDQGPPRSLRAGRYDINFAVGTHEYIAEAKQCWPKLHNLKSAAANVRDALRLAKADARSDISWGLPVLAIVFSVPRVPIAHASEVASLLDGFLRAPLPTGLVAWSFPLAARGLVSQSSRYIYPGVMVLVDQVRKGA